MLSRSPGFDYCAALRTVADDMARRLAPLAHIDMSRIAVGLCRARQRTSHGVYATLTPLRWPGGATAKQHRGRRVAIEPIVDAEGREYLYLLNFYLPRFADLPLEEKLTTIVHELWHVGPRLDGDLRRHEGRCFAHGRSRKEYDAEMARLAQAWLAADPPAAHYEFLERNFADLTAEYGSVRGQRFRAPRIVAA